VIVRVKLQRRAVVKEMGLGRGNLSREEIRP